jgi:hypothetical protein
MYAFNLEGIFFSPLTSRQSYQFRAPEDEPNFFEGPELAV